MNLDNAVAAHTQWKIKFRAAIERKEQMDAVTIAKDNCCELGKWLHGEGKISLGSKPEFQSLISKHKDFHSEAGKVASTINAGKYSEASGMLGAGSSFFNASTNVGVAIGALKKLV